MTWTGLFIRDARRYLDSLDGDERTVVSTAIDAMVWASIASLFAPLAVDMTVDYVSQRINNVFDWTKRR